MKVKELSAGGFDHCPMCQRRYKMVFEDCTIILGCQIIPNEEARCVEKDFSILFKDKCPLKKGFNSPLVEIDENMDIAQIESLLLL